MVNVKMDHPSQEFRESTGKVIQVHAGLYSVTGRDGTYEKALFPRLSATVRRPVQRTA
jgi:ribosomal protein L21E